MAYTHEDIKGTIVPVAMPMRHDKRFDEKGADGLVRHIVGPENMRPHVNALFLNGFTAEFPWTDSGMQHGMLDVALDAADGRVPVLQGVTARTLEEKKANARYAKKAGADGIVVAPFFFYPTNRGMPDKVKEVADCFSGPVYLYVNRAVAALGPRKNERELKTGVLGKMFRGIPNLWGIKYSCVDLRRFRNYRAAARQKYGAKVFMGDEDKVLDSYTSSGYVPSFGNVFPEFCGSIYGLEIVGDMVAARNRMVADGRIIYCNGKKTRPGLKYALHLMGICGEAFREPVEPLTADEKEGIRQLLKKRECI